MTADQQSHPTTESVAQSHKPRMLVGSHVQFPLPQCHDVLAELQHVPVGRLFSLGKIRGDQFSTFPSSPLRCFGVQKCANFAGTICKTTDSETGARI